MRDALELAIKCLDCELSLVEMELKYPQRFLEFPPDIPPLARWNGNMIELLEYFMPPQMAGKLSMPSGEPMTFIDLIKLIGSIFGVIANKPYDMKTKILARKKNITPFIDKMRQVILDGAKILDQ